MGSFLNRSVNRGFLRLLAVGAMWMAACPADAFAEDSAQARAAAYQTELRAVLKQHHWRITHDAGGTLTARHILGTDGADLPGVYTEPAGYLRLTTVFKPESATNTGTNIGLVALYVDHTDGTGKFIFKDATAFDKPETTKAVQDLFAEARKRVLAAHPQFAGR